MKLLDRLVLKDLVPQLLIGIGMFTALYLALGPILAASRFLSQGIPLIFVAKFVLYDVASILGQTFPMGMLLAVLLGFGRLSNDSETVALYAGGIPFVRIAAPAAALGLLVSLAGYLINDPVASYAAHQLVDLRKQALNQQIETDKPFDLPATRDHDVLRATVHVEKGFNLQARTMRDVTITLYDTHGRITAIYQAENAHPQGNDPNADAYVLDNVTGYSLTQAPTYQHWPTLSARYQGIDQSAIAKAPTVTGLYALLKADPNALPFAETRRAIAQFKRAGLGDDPDVRTDEVSLWNKVALPLASLVFACVGAPLALRPQRSSKVTGWVLSLPIILAYYVLYTVMGSVARGGACPPVLAAFLPDVIGLLVGTGLVWKQSVS